MIEEDPLLNPTGAYDDERETGRSEMHRCIISSPRRVFWYPALIIFIIISIIFFFFPHLFFSWKREKKKKNLSLEWWGSDDDERNNRNIWTVREESAPLVSLPWLWKRLKTCLHSCDDPLFFFAFFSHDFLRRWKFARFEVMTSWGLLFFPDDRLLPSSLFLSFLFRRILEKFSRLTLHTLLSHSFPCVIPVTPRYPWLGKLLLELKHDRKE